MRECVCECVCAYECVCVDGCDVKVWEGREEEAGEDGDKPT